MGSFGHSGIGRGLLSVYASQSVFEIERSKIRKLSGSSHGTLSENRWFRLVQLASFGLSESKARYATTELENYIAWLTGEIAREIQC